MQDVTGFDARSVRLPEVRLECWQGFIYVCLDSAADPIAPRLEGLVGKMAESSIDKLELVFLETVEYACNWKVLLENFCESYHLFCVHRETLEPMSPTRAVTVLEGSAGWNLHRLEYNPHDGLDAHTGYISAVYPNHAISFGGKTGLLWITPTPLAVDRTRLTLGVSSQPDIAGGGISEAFRKKSREFVAEFLSEDKEIIEAVQKNLSVFEPTQPYCDKERTNWEFGQYLVKRLLAEAKP
jgi:phenylpropionate dioxygenase-like ring-hydroxylating dioxygenase large terminal subunit